MADTVIIYRISDSGYKKKNPHISIMKTVYRMLYIYLRMPPFISLPIMLAKTPIQ